MSDIWKAAVRTRKSLVGRGSTIENFCASKKLRDLTRLGKWQGLCNGTIYWIMALLGLLEKPSWEKGLQQSQQRRRR
jgi:hypothetical protein